MRFPAEDVSGLTMQQLRGREGARVRSVYRMHAERTGVAWNRRSYNSEDFADADTVNQALSAATTCLYGIVHAVVVALGCSPGLGFVHTGHARSFVFDIADLYKAEIAIPCAFDVAARDDLDEIDDFGAVTRRLVRDRVHDGKILARCAKDVRWLLNGQDDEQEDDNESWDVVHLWDGGGRTVASGTAYEEEMPW